ncbi:MAG: hypothetical protein ACK501_06090 [Planctomycetota bacterium]|jgi:hypothetical protein
MVQKFDWHSLEIGYQAKSTNPEICKVGAPKPTALLALEATFSKSVRTEMMKGGTVELPDDDLYEDDSWAAAVLIKLLNDFLSKSGSAETITIHPLGDFVRFAAPGTKSGNLSADAKGVDTRCILREGRWYSMRSYRISRASNPTQPWFPKKPKLGSPAVSESCDYMVATLTWVCQDAGD